MDTLSTVFAALSDPTRRAILGRLAKGEATVGELASPFPISLPAVSRHLHVLKRAQLVAQLVEQRVDAQWRLCRLTALPLRDASDWIDAYRRFWDGRLDRIAEYLDKTRPKPRNGRKP